MEQMDRRTDGRIAVLLSALYSSFRIRMGTISNNQAFTL